SNLTTFAAQGLPREPTSELPSAMAPTVRMIARCNGPMAFFRCLRPALLCRVLGPEITEGSGKRKGPCVGAALHCDSCKRLGAFLCNDLADGGPFGHALPVITDFRKPRGINAVALHPLRHREQVGVADRIGVAPHPRPSQHFAFYQLVTGSDGVRHLALHGLDSGWIVGPAISAHSVGMRHVQRRTQIAVEGLHLSKGK